MLPSLSLDFWLAQSSCVFPLIRLLLLLASSDTIQNEDEGWGVSPRYCQFQLVLEVQVPRLNFIVTGLSGGVGLRYSWTGWEFWLLSRLPLILLLLGGCTALITASHLVSTDTLTGDGFPTAGCL